MSGNHTPTPWEYVHEATEYGTGKDDITFGHISQKGGNEYEIAAMVVDVPNGRANGEFIVTAVNSYASSQAEIERLTKALEPFAKLGAEAAWLGKADDRQAWGFDGIDLTWGDFRRAVAALSGSKE